MNLKPFLQLSALALPLLLSVTPVPAQGIPPRPGQPGYGDPFVKQPAPALPPKTEPDTSAQNSFREALVRLEWVSLSPADARNALRKHPRQADLYQWIQDELDKADRNAVTLERMEILRLRSGQRSKIEAIDELPYASEFDPAQQPQSIGFGVPASSLPASNTTNVTPPAPAPPPASGGAQGETGNPGPAALPGISSQVSGSYFTQAIAAGDLPANFFKTQVTPQSFNIKNTGWTVEMELTLSDDFKTADINIAPEHVKFAGNLIMDSEKQILQPIFESQKLATQVQARVGLPTLAGTMSPPIATGVDGGNKIDRVWLLFLTVSLPE